MLVRNRIFLCYSLFFSQKIKQNITKQRTNKKAKFIPNFYEYLIVHVTKNKLNFKVKVKETETIYNNKAYS